MYLLTKDYSNDPGITFSETIKLLKNVCITLCNIVLDSKTCDDIFAQYDILEILKNLIKNYFLTEHLQIQSFVANKDIEQAKLVVSLLDDMLFLVNNF